MAKNKTFFFSLRKSSTANDRGENVQILFPFARYGKAQLNFFQGLHSLMTKVYRLSFCYCTWSTFLVVFENPTKLLVQIQKVGTRNGCIYNSVSSAARLSTWLNCSVHGCLLILRWAGKGTIKPSRCFKDSGSWEAKSKKEMGGSKMSCFPHEWLM